MDDALATFRASLRRARAAGDPLGLVTSGSHVAYVCSQLGLYDEAERLLHDALEIARRYGLAILEGYALHNLGLAVARGGALDRAIAVENLALAIADEHAVPRLVAGTRIYLARFLCERDRADDVARAERELDAAAPGAESFAPMRAVIAALRARLLLVRGQPDDAARHAAEAFLLVEQLGGLDEGEELVRLTYVEALAAAGRAHEADAVLDAARVRFAAKAQRIRDPALRASFAARVPEHARLLELAAQRLGAQPPTDRPR
jgi:hypothetical protein